MSMRDEQKPSSEPSPAAGIPAYPEWLRESLAVPFKSHFREVEGARTEILEWGPDDAPPLLFVHGSLASAHWWRPFAPRFADRYRVIALSLSGMGGSDWRPRYSVEQFGRELLDAIEFSKGAETAPLVVAHSYGTWPAIHAATLHAGLGGLVLVDPPLPVAPRRSSWEGRTDMRLFDTRDAAIAQFRLMPDDFPHQPYMVRFIAEQSVAREGDRWRWRFDPKLRAELRKQSRPDLAGVSCPVAVLFGAESKVAADSDGGSIRDVFPNVQILKMIARAGHHVMLDQPLAFALELEAVVQGFEASRNPARNRA